MAFEALTVHVHNLLTSPHGGYLRFFIVASHVFGLCG
jgi:hypothetical protein